MIVKSLDMLESTVAMSQSHRIMSIKEDRMKKIKAITYTLPFLTCVYIRERERGVDQPIE